MIQKEKDMNHIWKFPETIGFERVSEYVEKLKDHNPDSNFIFDLSNTIDMHSSFIGFLIYTKYITEKKNGHLELILSYTTERILNMMNILHYFPSTVISISNKKTA